MGTANPARGRRLDPFAVDMLLLAWLPVLIIGVLHYATSAEHHWVHDVLRRLYYLPILFAAFSRGLRGALLVSAVVSLTYIPHGFLLGHGMHDPGGTVNKLLELLLYNGIGALAGVLADRESRRREQAEAAFAEQQRMAEQLIRAGRLAALGELVAGIAHEIKNPLHSLKGTAEIVDEVVPADSEQARMWQLHREELDRLATIAERFLSFARPNPPSLQCQPFSDVYARVCDLVSVQARGSKVALDLGALDVGVASTVVEVDRDQVVEVVLNVVQNGLRALGDAGQLRLAAALAERGGRPVVIVRIENDGPGIPEDQLERIFDPFFTRTEDGTGLGLAIAARIVEEHGGFLDARNLEGERGVQFLLSLPVAASR